MKISKLFFITLIFMLLMNSAQATKLNECQKEYKACMTVLIDKYQPILGNYGVNPAQCRVNHNKSEALDHQFVHCQDQYSQCKNSEENFWRKIHNTPDISLEKADPSKYGLSESDIDEIKGHINNLPNLKSLLVVRNGKLIYEKHDDSKKEVKPHHIFSITKSMISLLVGIAIDDGLLESEELLIKPYFPGYYSMDHDVRKDKITIKHALTMTTMLNFTDNNNWSYDGNIFIQFMRDDNARDWILDHEMFLTAEAGDQWFYGTPNTDLLSTIISTAAGMTTREYAEKHLFAPLGIYNYLWMHDSAENYYGGFSLFLRPRALARIGQMVLDGGVYQGKRIVSKQWLDKSLLRSFSLGGEDDWGYGYLWWQSRVGEHQMISAFGYGGQQISLVPDLNLMVVTTSDSDSLCSHKESESQFDATLDLTKRVVLNIDESN